MNVIIVLGGEDDFSSLYKSNIDDYIIGVDGGIKAIKKAKEKCSLAIGDFDTVDISSARELTDNIIKLNPDKDASDFDFAVDEARKLNPNNIFVYNYEGGRLDHYQAIINTLIRNKDLNITLLSNHNNIKIVNPPTFEVNTKFKYTSIFALENNTQISLIGFKYPLESKIINRFDNLCLSNEVAWNSNFDNSLGIIKTDKSILLICSEDAK